MGTSPVGTNGLTTITGTSLVQLVADYQASQLATDAAISTAKSQATNGDTSTLNAAKTYTDGEVQADRGRLSAIESKNVSQDTAIGQTLTDAKAYADQRDTDFRTVDRALWRSEDDGHQAAAEANAKTYTDAEITSAKAAVSWDKGTATDLNTLVSSGKWNAGSSTANRPVAVVGAVVVLWSTNTGTQKFTTREAVPRVYYRSYLDGAWGAWNKGETGSRLDAVEALNASQESAITSYGSRISATESKDAAQDSTLANHETRIDSVETVAGFAPGDVTDATMTSIAAQPDTSFSKEQAGKFTRKGELMINPKDYGARGNGSIDDTAAVTAAVDYAATTGNVMFWPNGGYKVTSNIPKLHLVKHRGNGYIIRDTTNFFPDPASNRANVLHVAPVSAATPGLSTNDGLSPSSPMDVQTALNRLPNYGPVLNGTWTIQHAAGTYQGGYGFPRIQSQEKIKFQGPAMGGARITPTAVYERGAAAIDWGIYTVDRARVAFRDLKFVGFNRTVINSGGIRVGDYNNVDLWNIHTDGCELGFFAMNHVVYNYGGCYFLNSNYAAIHELYMTLRNSTALTMDDRTVIQGGKFGIKSKELNTGHADRTEFNDCTEAAIHLSRASTMNFSYSTFNRNAHCVIVAGSSSFVDLYTTFGTGVNKNTVKYRYMEGAANVALARSENAVSAPFVGMSEKSLAYGRTTTKHTGTTSDTQIVPLGKFVQGDFQGEGAWIKWDSYGSANLTTAATLRVRVAGQGVVVITMPVGVYTFKFEGRMYVTANGDTQRADGIMYAHGLPPVIGGGNRTVPISTTSTDMLMGINVALGAAADSVEVFQAVMMTSDL